MAPIQVDQSQSVASSLNSANAMAYSDIHSNDASTCHVTEDFRLYKDVHESPSSSLNVEICGKSDGLGDTRNPNGNVTDFSSGHVDGAVPPKFQKTDEGENSRQGCGSVQDLVENRESVCGVTEENYPDIPTDMLVGENYMPVDVDDDEAEDNQSDRKSSSSSNDVSSFLARLDAEVDLVHDADGHGLDASDNPAIDRGYAWIICMAVFLIQFLLVGYLKSGGVLFVEFQKRFHSTSSMTSLIIGLEEAVNSIGAFVCVGFALKSISPRNISLIGSVLCVMGVAGSALFDRLEYLIITHSVCFGLSLATMYGTSIVVLNQYFVKRRALAVSIGTSGTSVGGIILPPLIRYLFNEYQYTGGILMTGGIMMHVFIAAALLIPVENHRNGKVGQIKSSSIQEIGADGLAKCKFNGYSRTALQRLKMTLCHCFETEASDIIKSSEPGRHGQQSFNNSTTDAVPPISTSQAFDQNKYHSTSKGGLNFETFNSKLEICEEGVPLQISTPANLDETNLSPAVSSFTKDYSSSKGYLPVGIESSSPFGSYSSNTLGSNPSIHLFPDHPTRYHNRVNSFRSGIDSDSNVDTDGPHVFQRENSRLNSSRQTLSASIMFHSSTTLHTVADMVTTDLERRSYMKANNHTIERSTIQRFRDSCCDNPLLRSLSFWLLTVFFFCGCIGHAVPQIYIPALAKERGVSDADGAFFLSLLNVLDIVSHLVPGILITLGVAKATRMCVVPMFIVGVVSQLTFLYNNYEALLIMSILFGLFGGFYFAMQSVIIIETLGVVHFGPCIGFYLLVMGFGAAVSFPIAGALKDVTGSYSSSYHYLAAMEFIATGVLVVLPLARKYDLKRKVLKEEAE